jgi:hypothetical protein
MQRRSSIERFATNIGDSTNKRGEIGRTLVEILTSLIIFRRIIFIKFIHASKEIIVFDKVGYKD